MNKISFYFFTVLALTLAGLAFWIIHPSFKDDPNPITVSIDKGWSAVQIAKKLEENKIIRSPSFFRFVSKITGKSKRFKHGIYRFEKNSYWKIITQLENGKTYKKKVTIPEGWTAYQIAERLQENGIITDIEAFVQTVKEHQFEGMLFPETYFFEPLIKEKDAAEEMVQQFHLKYPEDFKSQAKELKMTDRQILTLASIIEREAQDDSERPVISSVFHNRLKKRKYMESCATVQYALSDGKWWKEKLIYKDLNVVSPYNTYRHLGLPPGPICNPGLKSIHAALYPAKTDFLYFVADGTGKHNFFATYREHIQKQKENHKTK